MKRSSYLITGMFLGALLASIAYAIATELADSKDPVKVSPQYYKVLFENDQVRVLDYHLKPGEKEPMHSHPAEVVYVFGDATVKMTFSDGRSEEHPAKAGETFWREPVTHAVENTGTTEAHALAVDLKKKS